MIALSGWPLFIAALVGIGAAAFLGHMARIPRKKQLPADATVEERVSALEDYIVQSQLAWRANTRRFQGIVAALVAGVVLFTAWFTEEQRDDRAYVARFAFGSCLVTRENREAQQARDAREVNAAAAALDRHDAAVARTLNVAEIPPGLVPADLRPLLEFLAVDAASRRAAERQELVRDVAEARHDAEEYQSTFPIPHCDPDSTEYVPTVNTPEETDD